MLVVVSAIEKDNIDSAKCICLSDVFSITEDEDVIVIVFNSSTAIQTAIETIYKADITPRAVTYYNVQFKKENVIAILV
jgi:hypothetical protein|nr:MAG TPA: hypothetical protein [Crassvirales sp.]